MKVHEAKFTMPAGLSRNLQEGTSSVGDVVGHLLCRGGKVLMCGSSGSSNTNMFQWKRAHLLNMPLLPLSIASSPTLGTKNVTQDY